MTKNVTPINNLEAINPALAKEWNYDRNDTLLPINILPGSSRKVWWRCKNGHEWEATILNRSHGKGCPICYKMCRPKRPIKKESSLLIKNPVLARDWHPIKNGILSPCDITPGSNKKVWWQCTWGHEWQAAIFSRHKGSKCPYCVGNKVCEVNCLQTVNPSLVKEWHPTKNGKLTPLNITANSGKKVWWKCSKGHEWQAVVSSRNRGAACPSCCGRIASAEYSLECINPLLAKEWHPTKNVPLTPKDVTPSANKKVWWKCSRGHEWQAMIGSRNSGVRCPFCFSQTSSLELRLYTELKYIFDNVYHREKLFGVENDIFLPDLKCSIEIDGFYWHKDKIEQDIQKGVLLKDKNLFLLHIREKGLKKISDSDIFYTKQSNAESSGDTILNSLELCSN